MKIAVLITCYNRREKTIDCLRSFYACSFRVDCQFNIYLVDDGSTDGTSEAVKDMWPAINLIKGSGNLYWAGGMRLAWETAMISDNYDAFLLLNDDVMIYENALLRLAETDVFVQKRFGQRGIYCGATNNSQGAVTYGAHIITRNDFVMRTAAVKPRDIPVPCDFTNANILWVARDVVNKIGIFDYRFIHGLADYDYSLSAVEKGIPVFLAPGILGLCENDHCNPWKSKHFTLKERIHYLYSPKGLAYNEYLYYIGKHFPLNLPYSFLLLWVKTILPFFWDKFKSTL